MDPLFEPKVRRGTPADAEPLARLRHEFRMRRADSLETEDGFVTRCAAWMRQQLADERTWRVWVLEHENALVGNVWLQIVHKLPNPGQESELHGYLTNFFVREPYRGRGAGARLLSALLQESVAVNLDSIFLWPTEQSRPLYGRHGFYPATTMMILER